MARRADPSKWEKTFSDDGRDVVIVTPSDDFLGKKRADGKRPYKMPMRKIVAKLQQELPGGPKRWSFEDGWLDKDGKTCTFKLYR